MTIRNILASLCAAAFAFCIAIAPAYAQATRSWVSGVGNDGNSCTRTSPCLTFARALTQTVAGGEIDCLDSGGFGTVNIGKSVTINCEGAIGGVQAGGGATGINVNVTQSDVVYLRGLDIQGTTNGASGISVAIRGTHSFPTIIRFAIAMCSLVQDLSANGSRSRESSPSSKAWTISVWRY